MADIFIQDLSREQIEHLFLLMEVLGEPQGVEECTPILATLKAAEVWYLHKKDRLRKGFDE